MLFKLIMYCRKYSFSICFMNSEKINQNDPTYCDCFECKKHRLNPSLASRLNGYMYSNGTSLNLALFILMVNHLFVG